MGPTALAINGRLFARSQKLGTTEARRMGMVRQCAAPPSITNCSRARVPLVRIAQLCATNRTVRSGKWLADAQGLRYHRKARGHLGPHMYASHCRTLSDQGAK